MKNENNPLRILRGWEEIARASGLTCGSQAVRRLARQHGMPVFYLNRRPTISEITLRVWWEMLAKMHNI